MVMADGALRERLPALWRRIEDAHYSYLETEDSPDKLKQKKKLEGYITEYLSLVPHECKFALSETAEVFQRTIDELPDYSAYRAGIGWAAIARYAGNLLAQPWRKEYKAIRLYCGFYKHEVEANLVGAELLLQALGYRALGAGRLALHGPVCPDMVAAVSRDALLAHCECKIMCELWEAAWRGGGRASWADVARERAGGARRVGPADEPEIYINIPVTASDNQRDRLVDTRQHNIMSVQSHHLYADKFDEPGMQMVQPYVVSPGVVHPQMMYSLPHQHMGPEIPLTVPQNPMSMMTPYGPVPYYYPVQGPYMIPTPVYAPMKHAATVRPVPVNGYPPYRYPSVPTAQLIELDPPSVYENGKFERHREDERSHRKNNRIQGSLKHNSTSKSGFSDLSLPSVPRSDTQPTLSKAKEDGMGTYESWDYVFRNLSSKENDGDSRSGFSQSLDRDSRTLDRLDREERRSKYQPTTLDLEDGLQALNLDRSYDEDAYRTAKVNESLLRLKQEQELKRAKQMTKKKIGEDKKQKKPAEFVGNPKADGLVTPKIAPDKVKLLTKKEIKDRKDVIKQQNFVNGTSSSTAEIKVKKQTRSVAVEVEKSKTEPIENGVHKAAQAKCATEASTSTSEVAAWQCGSCTFLNGAARGACEMCGTSRRGPAPAAAAGGRQCAACTLVNARHAPACDACGAPLRHCATYI